MAVGQSIQRNVSASRFPPVTSLRGTSVSLSAHALASCRAMRQFPLSPGVWCARLPCSRSPAGHLLLLGLIRASSSQLLVKSIATGQGTDSGFNHSYFLTRETDFFLSTIRVGFASRGTRQVQGLLSICFPLLLLFEGRVCF